MATKILVTGATSKPGRRLVERLRELGAGVRAAARNPEAFGARYPGVETVAFDYDAPATWPAALDGVDVVFLTAPPLDATAHERVRPFVEAMAAAAVRRVALLSAFGANQNPEAPLAQIEKQLAEAPFENTSLRPNWFLENFSEGFFAPTIVEQNAIFMAAGDGKVSFIGSEDIAAAAVRVLTMPETPEAGYDLTGPEALTFDEVATLIGETAGRPIAYHAISEADQTAALSGLGLPDSAIAYMNGMCAAIRADYAAPTSPDLARLTGSSGVTAAEFVAQSASSWHA